MATTPGLLASRRRFLRRCGAAAAGAAAVALLPAGPADAGRAPTGLFFDPLFLEFEHAPGHPESPARARAVAAALMTPDSGLQRIQSIDARAALTLVHPLEHVTRIEHDSPSAHAVALRTVGGVLGCVDAVFEQRVRNAFAASRPPGHHAFADGREEGFCYYNAVAIAARWAQRRWGIRRVLIADWDYHHGNGTEIAFYSDPDVLVFSTHDWQAYPGTGDPSRRGEGRGYGRNINVHLDCGAGDAQITRAFDEHLLPIAHRFAPELVLISAGFDSRRDDLLGCFAVTDDGFVQLTRRMLDLADLHCAGRIVSVLEGGYNVAGTAAAAAAHVGALRAG